MDIVSQANIKAIYRVTGTPENFLTALRYKVWGFNKENERYWQKLLPGDIIFFHSKGSDSKFINKPPSSIIGFGVVGNNFYQDNTPLWIDEKIDKKTYPFKFSFSEVYLFTTIPINDDWDSTTLEKVDTTRQIIDKLLASAIPLGDLNGFPHMGSYSAIRDDEIKKSLLRSTKELSFYMGDQDSDIVSKSAELTPLDNNDEALRYATTLTIFDSIKDRIVNEDEVLYGRNAKALATAEEAHYDIVSNLRLLLAKKGYQVYANNHVDLYAHNKTNSLLVEAKSIENLNFIKQSRKGIIQLFEYNYFEISKFKKDKGLNFKNEISLLATSQKPKDEDYVNFINSLDIKTLAVNKREIVEYGNSLNLAML